MTLCRKVILDETELWDQLRFKSLGYHRTWKLITNSHKVQDWGNMLQTCHNVCRQALGYYKWMGFSQLAFCISNFELVKLRVEIWIAYLVPVFSLWLGSREICTSRLWVFNHLGVSASKFIALSKSSSPKGSNTTLWNRRQYPIQIYCNWTNFSQLAVFELGKVKGPNVGPWILGTQALTVAWEVRTSCLRDFITTIYLLSLIDSKWSGHFFKSLTLKKNPRGNIPWKHSLH